MDSENEFLKALADFRPAPSRQLEFRVYYDSKSGQILNYTNDELPGEYIVVDKETFAQHRFDCIVRGGKIVSYRLPIGKLVPSESGTPCTIDDVSIIAVEGQPSRYWSMRTYEQD